MKRRTWQDNADEFAALDQGEGWPFARLVACSVEKGVGNGQNVRYGRRDRDGLKVSAREFGERAGCSADRVLRYLTGWDKAAQKGWVPEADTLVPDSVTGMTDPEHNWKEVYDARKAGGRPRDSRPDDAVTIVQRRGAEAVVAAMPDEVKAQVARELGKTNVGMDAALEGYAQRPEEKNRRRAVKERKAADDEGEVVYHFRSKLAMPALLMLDALAGELTTEGDGRNFEKDDDGVEQAIMLSAALRSIADQIEAWAKGDQRDSWDRGLADLLRREGGAA